MDTPNSPKVISFLTLLLLFFLYSTSPTQAASQLVENICKETTNYTKCLEALGSDPRTKSAKNLKVLAKISLKLAINDAKYGLAFIKKNLNNKNKNERNAKPVLKQCVASYKAVIASFKSALAELSEDALTANYDVKVAADFADSCENEMVLRKVRAPLISYRNNQVRFYSNIGYVITNKLD